MTRSPPPPRPGVRLRVRSPSPPLAARERQVLGPNTELCPSTLYRSFAQTRYTGVCDLGCGGDEVSAATASGVRVASGMRARPQPDTFPAPSTAWCGVCRQWRVWVLRFEVWSLWFGVWGLVFRVQGSGFRVQGSEFRVQGSGFRVQGSGELPLR